MKHLFIVGCPRSGTTWTLMLLARHPRAVAAQHVAFFQALRHLEDWWLEHESQTGQRWGKSAVVVGGEAEGAGVAIDGILDEAQFYALCRSTADELFAGIVRRRPDAEVLIEKTPENVRVADFILKVYPDAYFLHIIRDPRSVYASIKSALASFEKNAVFPNNPMAGARFWQGDVERGRKIGELTDRYLEIRYESLLEDGPGVLDKVFSFAGLPADRAFCEETIEAASLEKLRRIPGAPEAFFRRGEAESWRDELTEEEVRILEYMLQGAMDELGYARRFTGDSRKPMKLAVEEALLKNYNRLEWHGIRILRKIGYVVPRRRPR